QIHRRSEGQYRRDPEDQPGDLAGPPLAPVLELADVAERDFQFQAVGRALQLDRHLTLRGTATAAAQGGESQVSERCGNPTITVLRDRLVRRNHLQRPQGTGLATVPREVEDPSNSEGSQGRGQ